ncbi:MAG TPA: AAA family ATPase [Candidatus Binataceae bacterium]
MPRTRGLRSCGGSCDRHNRATASAGRRGTLVASIVHRRDRQPAARAPAPRPRLGDDKQFFDRSPISTYALANYLGYAISAALSTEIERIEQDGIYQKRVFFVQSLGFITATDARKITAEDAMRFDRVHEETYRRFDYQIVPIAAAPLLDRVAAIKRAIGDALER